MDFESHERTQGKLEVASHGPLVADLHAFYSAALLQTPVVHLDAPALLRESRALILRHLRIIGDPEFRIVVFGDKPEDQDVPIAAQVDDQPFLGDRHLGNRHCLAAARERDQAIALQARQEGPLPLPQRLEILQAGVPAIEQHVARDQAAGLGGFQHRAEVRVLRLPTGRQGVHPEVARDEPLPVRPEKRQQVDALDDAVVFPALVVRHQSPRLHVGLIQRCVIEHQHPLPTPHEPMDFLPQRPESFRGCRCSRRVKASCAGAVSLGGAQRAASVQVKVR